MKNIKNMFLTAGIVKEMLKNYNKKNQNRRVIRNKDAIKLLDKDFNVNLINIINKYSKYSIGDIVGIKEPVKIKKIDLEKNEYTIEYQADLKLEVFPIKDKIKDKKWFKVGKGIPYGSLKEHSRIFLKITNVKIEKLQDISFDDIIKTGTVIDYSKPTIDDDTKVDTQMYYNSWIKLWNSILGKGYKWEDNPYVFVYFFERIEL